MKFFEAKGYGDCLDSRETGLNDDLSEAESVVSFGQVQAGVWDDKTGHL